MLDLNVRTGTPDDVPDIIYHGTGVERLNSIMEKGLLPTNLKRMSPYVKATRYKDTAKKLIHTTDNFKVASFFAVAGYTNGVVLEIDTSKIKNEHHLSTTVFKQYKEYRFTDTISSENIKRIIKVDPIINEDSWSEIVIPKSMIASIKYLKK